MEEPLLEMEIDYLLINGESEIEVSHLSLINEAITEEK